MPKTRNHEVKFTRVEKIFFPKPGFTKGDLIRYYLDVAPFIIPHLKARPVTLIRFPDGIEGERFYAKNAPPFAPSWLKTVAIARKHHTGSTRYIVIDDEATLAWCANSAAIELHSFLHHAARPDRPTQVVFDLDPGEGQDLRGCARVAFLIKEITDGLGLRLFAKVSGSKGLQLYVPLNTATTYAATGTFAKAVAGLLQERHPNLVVSNMSKSRRHRRVFIDWSQNSASKTTVAVYSLRGKHAEPYVSMPVTREELTRFRRLKALFFTPAAAFARLMKRGDLFADVLTLKQKLPKAFAADDVTSENSKPSKTALTAYEAKRDFSKTREPGAKSPARSKRNVGNRFVIQKHAASRLHYDFRLEMGGTLKSWAVPKGVPLELGVKHAAFAVEDHPIDYLKFEGTIPAGEYGGGTVMVWDIGTYELLGGDYAKGTLKVRLDGKKLTGEWHLFKIRSEDGKDVWLIAKSGQDAKAITRRQEERSALTQRSLAGIAKDQTKVWTGRRKR